MVVGWLNIIKFRLDYTWMLFELMGYLSIAKVN
jgi:hypothetical protein